MFFLIQVWMRIQHASPLAHEWMCKFWLRYIPAYISSGIWIHFGIFCSTIVGEDLACWSPYSQGNVNFGFNKSLLVPAMGFGFILNFFCFTTMGDDLACWSSLFTKDYMNFGCNKPLPVWAVEFWIKLKFFFCTTMGEDPTCWSPCSRKNVWILSSKNPCWYWQWGLDSFWNVFFSNCGWGSNMLVPLLTRDCVNSGFHISLSVPAVGFGFILKFFCCTTVGEDQASWSPCSQENVWILASKNPYWYQQ